ncbi:hypothetical protein [Acetobacter sp. DmW_136]|nr:hypothetical protein [Acetobacter sp. DmW_136]
MDYLDRTKDVVREHAPDIVQRFERLKERASRAPEDDLFLRTEIAYAVQDFSRVAGPVLPDTHPLATEMAELATSAPDVQSKDVQKLIAKTANLTDQRLVDQIRDVVDHISSGTADPEHPDVLFSIDKLNRAIGTKSIVNDVQNESGPQSTDENRPGLHPSPGGGHAEENKPSADQTTPQKEEGRAGPQNAEPTTKEPVGTDKEQNTVDKEPEAQKDPDAQVVQKMSMGAALVGGFSRLAGALATKLEAEPSSVSPGWLDRAREKSQRHDAARAEKDMDHTAHLGSEAIEAMQALRQGPGSSILAAISEAAASDPGGMSAVLSEMKPGGKYASLHGQFEAEKQNNQAFASNLENAASKLDAYGKGREAAQKVGETMSTTTRVEQRFAQIDAQIGKEAESLPGSKAGTSMVEELGEKTKELVKKAVETLARLFRAAPSSGPTMSPG